MDQQYSTKSLNLKRNKNAYCLTDNTIFFWKRRNIFLHLVNDVYIDHQYCWWWDTVTKTKKCDIHNVLLLLTAIFFILFFSVCEIIKCWRRIQLMNWTKRKISFEASFLFFLFCLKAAFKTSLSGKHFFSQRLNNLIIKIFSSTKKKSNLRSWS